MINVGLIGFGFSGRTFHAPVISAVPGMRVAAILQRHTGDAKSLYPDARVVNKIEDLLSDDIELVVIATPNTSHAGLARQCLLAKRHVVVDKPFTTTLREASELVGLSQKCGRILS